MLSKKAQIAKLALFGNPSQAQIAEKLGIDQATVSRHLKEIREEWKQSALNDMTQIIARELSKLDALEDEALVEWERSKKNFEKTTVEKGGRGTSIVEMEKTEEYEQTGDPRYLSVIISIQERRAKLLGMDKNSLLLGDVNGGSLKPRIIELVAPPAVIDAEKE